VKRISAIFSEQLSKQTGFLARYTVQLTETVTLLKASKVRYKVINLFNGRYTTITDDITVVIKNVRRIVSTGAITEFYL